MKNVSFLFSNEHFVRTVFLVFNAHVQIKYFPEIRWARIKP